MTVTFENSLIVDDSNSEIRKSAIEDLGDAYYLHDLIKDPTCFKNPDKPSCMDLILTSHCQIGNLRNWFIRFP